MTDEMGFKVYNKFYPLIRFEDWVNQDFVLARKLTGINPDELLSRNADTLLLQQVLVAVAVMHERRELNFDQVCEFIWSLKPREVDEVGFEVIEPEDAPKDDAGAEQNPSDSSESSGEPTDATPAPDQPETSGQPGSDTGSQE